MSTTSTETGSRACWFVGAMYDGGKDDQMPRFLEEGIWENGYKDRYLDQVKSISPGDRIAIKSTYTRKHKVPFETHGHTVSVMAIKATGTVLKNFGDGRRLGVDWTPIESPSEWYLNTGRTTIWRVQPGDWMADALIAFTFENVPQDHDRFRNHPSWRERFGDVDADEHRFGWTRFYGAVADGLLSYRDKRKELVASIHEMADHADVPLVLQDQFGDGTSGPMTDICPFTAMGIFNRGITDTNRKAIATELAAFLGVEEPVPETFEGIPVLNNQRSWFFGYAKNREANDIDVLWEVFSQARDFADADDGEGRSDFADAYDRATQVTGVGWNLTMGLYWVRPWAYPTLDSRSRGYIDKKLGIELDRSGPKGRCNAADYLGLMAELENRFKEDTYPVHSFPDLSLAAWSYRDKAAGGDTGRTADATDEEEPEDVVSIAPLDPYSVENILADGCFLDHAELAGLLQRLRTKKNLILQGPPGTGKTWLAKRLGFALVGQRDESKLRALQFHPNLCYEDFVRGWRPSGEGKLSLVDGPFLEAVKAAKRDSGSRYVVVIEEINRGNPAQIFGEMLTLIEADKRTPDEALELCYRRKDGERVYVPANLYIIGTMNIADRSLALVDLALRRRFAFVELEPKLNQTWHEWVAGKWSISGELLSEIQKRISALNKEITADTSLGRQFRVGHSYVTPPVGVLIDDPLTWFREVVRTEIGPLLDEYWFDALHKAQEARERLLEGL
jgi:5-methylcytosine-specific restriction enzyme B